VRINPFVDLHYLVRKHVNATGDAPTFTGFAAAVAAAREVEATLGGPPMWGLIEGTLGECSSAAEAHDRCVELPETFRSRTGRTVELRSAALRLVAAYAPCEPAFLAEIWPRHRTRLEQAHKRIAADLLPHEAACFAYMLDCLAMQDPHRSVPVYLVAEAPDPGGFTHRYRGGGVCFVGLEQNDGTLLYEMILHEAIHALDIATEGQNTALQVLRQRLRAAGCDSRSPTYRDVPHTLMFVQAGETIRRQLDPAHRHYGDVAGYYAKVPAAAAAVRPNWEAYLHEKLPRERALEQIVQTAVREQKDSR
jgi:hypothetical protein